MLSGRSASLSLHDLSADSQGNISCGAVNDGGAGEQDTLTLIVFGKKGNSQEYFFSYPNDFQPRHLSSRVCQKFLL